MTVQELYKRLLLMVNKNDTNEGIYVPKGNFILLYNSEQQRWLAEELKKDIDNIDSNLIELLFLPDVPVTASGVANKKLKFIDFNLPSDFFQVYGSYSFADRGRCKNVQIWNWEKKPGDTIAFRSDENSKPSFDYQEAPFLMGGDKIRLYFDDYLVKDTYVNYYRLPKNIDIEGYPHFDGSASTNIDPELDDYNAIQVLARVAVEIDRQVNNSEGVQFDKDRINTEFP
jgi:hypothetical protein